jgi:hypothetical protein
MSFHISASNCPTVSASKENIWKDMIVTYLKVTRQNLSFRSEVLQANSPSKYLNICGLNKQNSELNN